MKKVFTLLLPAIALMFQSCGPQLEGSGQVIKQKRSIEEFSQIDIQGPLTVVITPGEKHSAEIVADNNLHPYISSLVNKNKVLHLEVTKEPRSFSKMEVHLTVPDCKLISSKDESVVRLGSPWTIDGTQLIIRGESQLKANLKTSSVKIKALNDAQVQASGGVKTAHINSAGKAELNLTDLKIDDAILKAKDKSELNLVVAKTLSVEASDRAVITYAGKAEVVKSVVEDKAVLKTR